MDEIDWEERWRGMVEARAAAAGARGDPGYWDRRAKTFARSTAARADEFLAVVEPFLAPTKTLIDVGAGAGRHAVPLASRLEWVTAVEPSEGMRANITPRDNMTVVASNWEDAEVAAADLVICSHVLYGVADPVHFISKLDASARERVFVMLRETDMPHPAVKIRSKVMGSAGPRLPRFSELFMLLLQMGIAPEVTFLRYPFESRYADLDEALADSRALCGDAWDETVAREILEEALEQEDGDLVFHGGDVLSGVAHWHPRR
jgi:hypothetical protein